MKSSNSVESESKPTGRGGLAIRLVAAGVLVALATGLYLAFGDALSWEALADQETRLRQFQADNPVLVYGLAFLVYVTVTGLSLPGATVLTLLYGWYFGWARGVILVSLASTTGATVAFLTSRFLFRRAIQQRFGSRLQRFNEALDKEGPLFLFSLRLIPAVPFFVINAVMGLTPIRVWSYWWISQLGMLPATVVYVYAGSAVPDLTTLADEGVNAVFSPTQLFQLFAAFVLLGLFPLLARWSLKRLGIGSVPAADSAGAGS